MRLFTYIITDDTGFAPNPYWGYCTLATCKPKIRHTAKAGDWVVGLSPKADGNKLIYAMKIQAPISYDDYYRDTRFSKKKPDLRSGEPKKCCGDNIYQLGSDGQYVQHENAHHGASDKQRDVSAPLVLFSGYQDFCYFGKEALDLRKEHGELLDKIKVLRGHRCRFDQVTIDEFLRLIKTLPKGIQADPHALENNTVKGCGK